MDGLRKRIEDDLRTAMKAGEKDKLACLRMIKSKLQEQEVALRGKKGKEYSLSDDDVQTVVSSYAKQRRDSIASYREGGRGDLAAKEEAELKIISAYLPEQMGQEEIEKVVREAVAESGATSAKDMGKVMKILMPRVKGKADGKLVNEVVRAVLAEA